MLTEIAATGRPVLPLLRRLACGGLSAFSRLLSALDDVAANASSAQDAAHALAAIAEALSLRADNTGQGAPRAADTGQGASRAADTGQGGSRAGPAADTGWGLPQALLRSGRITAASRSLARARGFCIATDNPLSLSRAAGEYNTAVAICVALCVRTCAVAAAVVAAAAGVRVGGGGGGGQDRSGGRLDGYAAALLRGGRVRASPASPLP